MKDHKEIIQDLISKGHSVQRAEDIYDEAMQSSDPVYVLEYYGCKINEVGSENIITQ